MARAAVIPPSPAKRARGRPAAAATTAAARAKTKTTTTAATTKATIEARKRANARAASRDTDDGTDEDELGAVRAKPGRGKAGTAGRGRKPTATPELESDDDDDELAQVNVPKKMGRSRAKPATTTAAAAAASKPRGRPKGSTITKPTTTKTRVQKEEIDDMDATALRSNMRRGPVKKKTVTFQDVSGSEDEVLEEDETFAGRKKATAKPARKAPGTGRGRKPVAPKSPAKPLSPKKTNQVTKSLSSYASSDGEDDELFAGKPAVESPVKRASAKTGLSSPVKRINLTPGRPRPSRAVDENGDPVRRSIDFNDIITVSSPNREPSPSPFHYTLRETPRRIAFEPRDSTHTKPLVQPNFGASSQGSPLKASPRKAPVGTPRGAGFGLRDDLGPVVQPNFTPGANSPLKSSPKKGRFGSSLNASTMANPSQPNFTPAQSFSPLKSSPKKGNLAASFSSQGAMQSSMPAFNPRISFLQSPAKKPASPFKSSMTTPLTFKSSLVEQTESTTPDTEGPLRAGDLDEMDEEMEQEDSEDELTMENPYNRSAQPERIEGDEDEMDEVAAVGEHEHESMGAEPAHEESSLDLGEELAETFSVKDDAHIEETVRNLEAEVNEEDVDGLVQDVLHDFVGYTGGSVEESVEEKKQEQPMSDIDDMYMEGPEQSSDHEEVQPMSEPASDPYEHQTHEMHVEELEYSSERDEREPEFEPASEPNVEHHDTHEMHVEELEYSSEHDEPEPEPTSEPNFEHTLDNMEGPEYRSEHDGPEPTSEPNVENHNMPEMHMEEREYSSEPEHQPTSEPNVEHRDTPNMHMEEPEYSSEVESEPESPQQEPAQHPTSEIDIDDDLAHEDSDDMDMVEPTIEHEVQSEEYDGSDEDFDVDDGTTLVGMDTIQRYADEVRSPSPQQVIEPEPERSPEHVREFRDVGVQFPSPSAARDSNYRDPMDQQVESDEDAQSQASESSMRKRSSHGRQSLFANAPGFSPLTQQFSEWKAATPEGSHPRRPRRGIFSLGDKPRRPSARISGGSAVSRQSLSSRKSLAEVSTTHEEEPEPQVEPETLEDDATKTHEEQPEIFTDPEPEIPSADAPVSHSIPSQDASPTRSIAPVQDELDDEKENEAAPSPATAPAPATPMKTIEPPQTFHTVSKVPLKPEGHISPLKMPLKRARSLSNASPTRASPRLRASFLLSQEEENNTPNFSPRKSPRMDESPTRRPQRRSSVQGSRSVERRQSHSKPTKLPSRSPSPTKSPRKSIGATSQALQGAVVYVDVHTTEGEDASGIFIELLQQMGARCVKNWSWNPRASVMPEQGTDQKDGKVGITHVVYKDGGVRTLEKVRSARGLVKCVGVGWVLDCERENQWLDEAQYAVDSSIIPRGGGKRRKSMEPRALSNVNGTLVKTATPTMDRRRSGYSPVARDSERPQTPTSTRKYTPAQPVQTPGTPGYRFNMDDYTGMSPATPFYLSRAKIVQQTCPPKQTRQGLFPVSSSSKSRARAEDPGLDDAESSKSLRLKLEAARRKSLAYKPRRESPLVQ